MSVRINVIAGWVCHVTGMLIGFFLMPYVLGIVGDASYGTWLLLSSLAGYTGLLYLGFGETIARYTARQVARQEWEQLNETISGIFAAYLVSGAIAILAAIVLALAAPYLNQWDGQSIVEVQWAIVILGINAAVSICGSVNGGILYGIQRFDIERSIQIAGQFVRLGLIVALLSVRQPLLTLALIFTAVTLTEQWLYYVAARRRVPTLRIRLGLMRWNVVKESYGFAVFNGLGLVATKLIYETDTIVIGFSLGATFVVPYAIGLRLCEMIRQPIRQVGEVFLPRAGELLETGRRADLQSLVIKGMGLALLLSGGFFIGAWYFGGLLIETWMPKSYPDSHLVFTILVGAQMAALPVSILHMVLVGMGQVRMPSLLRLLAAACNLVLSLVLVRFYGIVGVAIGTLIPILLIDLCVLLPYGARQLGISFWPFVWQVAGPQLAPLTGLLLYSLAVASRPLEATWPTMIAVTVGGGIALGATWGAQWAITRRASASTLTT